MTQSDDELDRALERMTDGAPLDPALKRYAGPLRSLDALRPTPDRDPQAAFAGRQAFLSEAAAAPVSQPALSRHRLRTFDGRKEIRPMSALVGLLVALALLFGGGGATALAAQDALPNDALYGVKLATEDLQFGLTSDPAQQVALLEDWADRRIQEMEQLLQSGEDVPLETALRLQTQLAEAIRIAAQLQDSDLTPTLLRLQTRLETHLRTMEQLRIEDPSGAALRTAQQAMIQTHAEIQGALEDPAAFRTRYGAGRPADAPEQPEIVPGEPPVSSPGTGQGGNQGDGQGGGQGSGEGQNPDAGQGAGSQGSFGSGDGMCACTAQADGSQLCTAACLQYTQGTGSQRGGGQGTANCECAPQADGMLLCSSACEPLLYLWSTPGPHGYGRGPNTK